MNEKICETLIEMITFYGDMLYIKIKAGSILSVGDIRISFTKRLLRYNQYDRWWATVSNKTNAEVCNFMVGNNMNTFYNFLSRSFKEEDVVNLTVMLQTRVMELCI